MIRNQSELKVSTCNRPQARENASHQVVIGFSFASDWLRGLREISKPITERSKAKPMQSRITFDTQLKIVLLLNIFDLLIIIRVCLMLIKSALLRCFTRPTHRILLKFELSFA